MARRWWRRLGGKSNFTSVENVTLFLNIFIAGNLSACVTFLESIEAGHAPLRPPGIVTATPYGQKIETAQRRQCSNIFGLGPVLHNKLAVDA